MCKFGVHVHMCVVSKTKVDDRCLPPALPNEACYFSSSSWPACWGNFLSFVFWVTHEPLGLGIKLSGRTLAQNAQDSGFCVQHCLQPLSPSTSNSATSVSSLYPLDSPNSEPSRRFRETFKVYMTVSNNTS